MCGSNKWLIKFIHTHLLFELYNHPDSWGKRCFPVKKEEAYRRGDLSKVTMNHWEEAGFSDS